MSAAYLHGTAATLVRSGPCQLVAVLATPVDGAGSVTLYDGIDASGEPLLTLAVDAASAAFAPALPVALCRGLYVGVSGGCEFTVVWV